MTFSHDETAIQEALPTGVPETVGRFRVLRQLGVGGMGLVLLAHDGELGRTVAIKLISVDGAPGESSAGEAERARFAREARSAAKLNHPNIATVYDVGTHDDQPFLAMEYVVGQTLAAHLASGPLPITLALPLAQQLGSALKAAHEAGVIHRDLKPGNIIITPERQAKLLDFGLARPVQADADTAAAPITRTGAILGTPAYMSPEQAQGEAVDASSDVFSLGVVLYEAITGENPFAKGSLFATLSAIVHHTPPPIDALRPEAPPSYVSAVERCLHKIPSERPSSEELFALLSGAYQPRPASTTRQPEQVPGRVAVLPLTNTSRSDEHAWVGIGFLDTLEHELRRSEGISVVGASEVGGAAEKGLEGIGARLRAEWVVKGSYQVAGPRLRIMCSVSHVPSETETSCERVDGVVDDIFELQDRVVEAVRAIIHTQCREARQSQTLARIVPVEVEAYELYAKGLLNIRRNDETGMRRAFECFEAAVAIDPEYANAWVGLGMVQLGNALHSGGSFDAATESLERALAINSELASAHAWLAHACAFSARFELGQKHGERAVALDPESVDSWIFYGLCAYGALTQRGGDPDPLRLCATCVERAILIAPHYGSLHHNLAVFLLYGGELERATRHLERSWAFELSGDAHERWIGSRAYLGFCALIRGELDAAEPLLIEGLADLEGDDHIMHAITESSTHLMLGELRARQGRLDEAQRHFEFASSAQGPPGVDLNRLRARLGLARLDQRRGERGGAQERCDAVEAELRSGACDQSFGYDTSLSHVFFDLAATRAHLGDTEAAAEALEEAIRRGYLCHPRYDTEPAFDAMRAHPRFCALRDTMTAFDFNDSVLPPSLMD